MGFQSSSRANTTTTGLFGFLDCERSQVGQVEWPGLVPDWKANRRGFSAEDFEVSRYLGLQRMKQLASQGRLDLVDLRMRSTV